MSSQSKMLKIMNFAWRAAPPKLRDKIKTVGINFYHQQKNLMENRPAADFSKQKKQSEKKEGIVIKRNPKISIIIPTFNRGPFLENCLRALEQNTNYKNYEIIIVNNNTFEEDALRILKNTKYKVINYLYKFNFSKLNNYASRFASGQFLVFLNNDTILQKDWLTAMLSECLKKGVGAVGSKLVYPNGTVQHAGIMIDRYLKPEYVFQGRPSDTPDANILREYDAVSGACMMIRKGLFLKMGRFDEEYWMENQDVDFCLKLKKKGLKVIYTPYSVVIHHGRVTRPNYDDQANRMHDDMLLKKKWFEKYYLKKEGESKKKRLKILVIKLMTMGDVVLTLPVAEALKRKYSFSHITFAVSKRYADVVKDNPFTDDLVICKDYDALKYNHQEYHDAVTKELLETVEWDKAFDLNCISMGYDFHRTGHHLGELYAEMAGVDINDFKPVIKINNSANSLADNFIKKNCRKGRKTILIHTRAGWDLKNWDSKKFQLLTNELKKHYNFIQIGSKYDFIMKNIPHFLVDPIKPMVAMIKRADLLIGVDSGPMHIASAIATPVIALFGSTSPSKSGPLWNNYICIQSDDCCNDPCYIKQCSKKKDYNCTEEIDIRDVLKAVNKMINRKGTIQETWWCGFVYPGRAEKVFNVSPLKRALEK